MQSEERASVVSDRVYRKVINSWAMYDWANSAFITTVAVVMFPHFQRQMVTNAGLSKETATAYLAYTNAIALLLAAVISPVLGAISDHTGGRKHYLGFFVAVGVLATALLVFLGPTSYILGSILFVVAEVGFAGGEVFYESLLPHIAQKGDIDQISARGYALGYLGGGILLAVNALWFVRPQWFGMPDENFAVRASFLSVALWWALFSIPLFRNVPEPQIVRTTKEAVNAIRAGFGRLAQTLRRLTRYKQLFLFLIAFWIYNDGIGTIIKMAFSYGEEMRLPDKDMVIAVLLTQFIGVPCAFAFGRLARRLGAKRSILLGVGVYIPICIVGYFMTSARVYLFYVLAFMVGLVQGGTQALSRSLYGAMVPKSRSTEFFGFFSTSSKFAGLFGLVLFGVISQVKGSSHASILSVIVFFVIGGFLLTRVDEKEGIRIAKEEDVSLGTPTA